MTFDIRKADLAPINSLTKYPSIPTYHALDSASGRLLENAVPVEDFLAFDTDVIGTEKLDGTNARIVFLPDGSFVIGSRENLLYGKGDLIGDPAQGIVAALKETAERVNALRCVAGSSGNGFPDMLQVFYLEVFGGNVSAASKQYTGTKRVSCRLFDAVELPHFEQLLQGMQNAAQVAL